MLEKDYDKYKALGLDSKKLASKFKISYSTACRINRTVDFKSYQRDIWQANEIRRLKKEKQKSNDELEKLLRSSKRKLSQLDKLKEEKTQDLVETLLSTKSTWGKLKLKLKTLRSTLTE